MMLRLSMAMFPFATAVVKNGRANLGIGVNQALQEVPDYLNLS